MLREPYEKGKRESKKRHRIVAGFRQRPREEIRMKKLPDVGERYNKGEKERYNRPKRGARSNDEFSNLIGPHQR